MAKRVEEMSETEYAVSLGKRIVMIAIVALVVWLAASPYYNLWASNLRGQAKLKEAESTRQVATLEAKAKLESAKLLAEAEVERARGVKESNQIIGEGLKGHEEYLMYLWIQTLGDKDNHVIYIPTEANIPIMEAGRFAAMGKHHEVPPAAIPHEDTTH